ncbi:MAG TPA: hypothetical protein PKM27_16050 [Saprospiraceae bacterium]|nr:hypothetical protein [Saprospiraceae bacterium]HNT20878.1 hypothetical protein [Saprospiraceae bacterium]
MKRRTIVVILLVVLATALAFDLYLPVKKDFRQFDPAAVGRLDAEMWRSYYEKRPVRLFFQLSRLMRTQFHAPYIRSHFIAYQSAKAAFVFKEGRNRIQYAGALPYLKTYFSQLNDLSKVPFNFFKLAEEELEWWIIRREGEKFTPSDWEAVLAREGEIMYSIPKENFMDYARDRVAAMVLRDQKGQSITEQDWQTITQMCISAWTKFHAVVQPRISSAP